nr:hypothetical protein [Candidatus Freyarchaeota archaeon]
MITLERSKCTFCNEAEAAYYCEECKASFCLRCALEKKEEYSLCGSCGSIEIRQVKDKNSKIVQKCQNCGSTNVRIGLKKWKMCPNCNSTLVKSILDKRLELKKAFSKHVGELIYGYELLKDFLRRLRDTRKRLIFLRHRGYLHYPKMEEIIASLFQEIISIKRKVEARAQQVLNVIHAQLVDFSHPDNWSPRDFPQIQTSIERITADINEYKKYVKELLSLPEKNLETVTSTVKLLSSHWKLFEEHREKVDLDIGEKPVAAIPGVKYVGSSFLNLEKCNGVLLFTDKRLIFVREKGLLNKSYIKHFEFPIRAFRCGVEGSLRKRIVFNSPQGDLKFSAPKNTLEAVERYAELARNFDQNSVKDKNLTRRLESLDVALTDLKRDLNSKIQSVFKPRVREPSLETVSTTHSSLVGKVPPMRANGLPRHQRVQISRDELQRKILLLKKEKFSIEQLLKKVERLWQSGDISVEEYLKRLKNLNGELYMIDQKLKELGARSETVARSATL